MSKYNDTDISVENERKEEKEDDEEHAKYLTIAKRNFDNNFTPA